MSSVVSLNVETSEVVRGLRRGVEVAPDDANAHLLLGTALAEAGQLADALGHLQRAVELVPSLVRGHIRLGNLLRELSRTGEADVRALELRGRLRRSPLMDHAGYARELTEALEGLVTA